MKIGVELMRRVSICRIKIQMWRCQELTGVLRDQSVLPAAHRPTAQIGSEERLN